MVQQKFGRFLGCLVQSWNAASIHILVASTPALPLLVHLGKQWINAQVLEISSLIWETRIEFLAPDYTLIQQWLFKTHGGLISTA